MGQSVCTGIAVYCGEDCGYRYIATLNGGESVGRDIAIFCEAVFG